jgi:hypothetical protein
MSDKDRKTFMSLVTLHERSWGLETYKGRPTLRQIMDAKIVAFWYPTTPEMPFTLTCHRDFKEIEKYVLALLQHTNKELPRLRLGKVFCNQKQVKIRVSVRFDVQE